MDINRDGFIDGADKQNSADFNRLMEIADRDGDGRLNEAEMAAWLELQDSVARGHALLTILNHGDGIF